VLLHFAAENKGVPIPATGAIVSAMPVWMLFPVVMIANLGLYENDAQRNSTYIAPQ
jgi:hypothetical protein